MVAEFYFAQLGFLMSIITLIVSAKEVMSENRSEHIECLSSQLHGGEADKFYFNEYILFGGGTWYLGRFQKKQEKKKEKRAV